MGDLRIGGRASKAPSGRGLPTKRVGESAVRGGRVSIFISAKRQIFVGELLALPKTGIQDICLSVILVTEYRNRAKESTHNKFKVQIVQNN